MKPAVTISKKQNIYVIIGYNLSKLIYDNMKAFIRIIRFCCTESKKKKRRKV